MMVSLREREIDDDDDDHIIYFSPSIHTYIQILHCNDIFYVFTLLLAVFRQYPVLLCASLSFAPSQFFKQAEKES